MYQADITGDEPTAVLDAFWLIFQDEIEEEASAFTYAKELFLGAYAKISESDPIIAEFLKEDWSFDRLSCTVKNIFRLAVYEFFETDTPHFAILTDYVNLACAFDDEKSAVFVNGLLDRVRTSNFGRRCKDADS